MDNNTFFSKPLAILRGMLLLLVYSTLFFFVFYYGHSNQVRFFDGELSTYTFYFLVCLVISVWMGYSQSFNKQVFKVSGALIVLDIVAIFIPVGFVSLGMALFPTLIHLLILLIISTLIYNLSKILSDKQNISAIIAILLFLILCPIVYANYNDLSVKQRIIYKNNAMFDSIEECNAYLYGVRENDCKKKWTTLHDNWDLLEKTKNINLIPNQKAVTGSDNYQYFPTENISDIKIGTGEVARYDDKAIVNILSATINGKIYDHPKKSERTNTDEIYNNFEVNLNTSVESYKSYALGVIGMKVGGVRKINFKTPGGFWFSGTDPMVSVGNNEMVSYTVELVSIKK